MNEKIKQLAADSGAVFDVIALGRHDGVLFTETELEKFAEKIIQECIEICDKVQIKYGQYTFTARICKEDIKEHFGVE